MKLTVSLSDSRDRLPYIGWNVKYMPVLTCSRENNSLILIDIVSSPRILTVLAVFSKDVARQRDVSKQRQADLSFKNACSILDWIIPQNFSDI